MASNQKYKLLPPFDQHSGKVLIGPNQKEFDLAKATDKMMKEMFNEGFKYVELVPPKEKKI
jgi:hypothetical protein